MRLEQIFPIYFYFFVLLIILFSCRTAINSQEVSLQEARPGSNNSNHILMPLLLKTEIYLTDVFLAISSDLRSGRQTAPDKVSDSTGGVLLRNVVEGAGLKKSLETQEPDFSGYRALKMVLGNALDSMSDCNRTDSSRMLRQLQIIQFNLDRWRQEKTPFAKRYVYINIPSFMLQVMENDTVVFSSKVIVGTAATPTPEISSIIECFTIYPYWHVPRKIAIEEYLPVIKKDSTFISRNNFDVLDRKGRVLDADSIEWSTFHKNYFPVVLRQREGEENSLGVVKFVFDNPYAVYLHDTNAKRLFRSSRRAFSHGCIRMEKALDLAHYLVTGELHTRSRMVDRYLKEKRRQTINVKTPIPVYSRYFTAEVIDGKFHLYNDIYNKEPEMVDAPLKDRGSEARK